MVIELDVTQKKIAYAAVAVIVLMGVFPPWYVDMPIAMSSDFTRKVYLGYGFIGNPCLYDQGPGNMYGGMVNFTILLLQWLLSVILSTGLICLVKDWRKLFSR